MKEKVLIFIPYQDADNFYSDGIMTREYAMLYLLWNEGYKTVINVKKPRTFLDRKKYQINSDYFLNGTKESIIKNILDKSNTIQYLPWFNFNQIIKKRGWWVEGYQKTINKIKLDEDKEYLVYSNNPYAGELIKYLSDKGCKIYFDIMDNFAIHPSLNNKERQMALEGYKKIFNFSDCISANSQQTCDYMQKYTDKAIFLIKNGVFANNEAKDNIILDEIKEIRNYKEKYSLCVGYIGKLGLRLDEDLIDEVSKECNNVLFVFVGDYLKAQINKKLFEIFNSRENVLHINGVPSSYVYQILNEFDILSIPHSVGKAENGGDPLKLYQYLTRNKPIITTPILGVEEFKDVITITSNVNDWINYINSRPKKNLNKEIRGFFWEERVKPIKNIII